MVNTMEKLKFLKMAFLAAPIALVACGGGGGSSGQNTLPYSITLKIDKTHLPLNVGHYPAGIGAYAPYSTTLYVEARQGGMLIPGGEDIFACNVAGGLDSGALYYLDGDDEHEDEDGNPLAFRNIALDANSGGNSFHFHAGDKAGTSRITCSVNDPKDGRVYAASVDVVVGGATNKPGNVFTNIQAPGYLGSENNVDRLPNSVVIQSRIFDDLNQPVGNPKGANLRVRILPTGAYVGSRTLAGQQSRGPNEELWVATTGGIGSFMLSSGPNTGKIVLEMTADRFDNDITNGIADPITSLVAVDVVPGVATTPLALNNASLSATVGLDFAYALSASGGVPPYKFDSVGGMPAGLGLTSDGIVLGRPLVVGASTMVVRVTDMLGKTATANIPVSVDAPEE